eukprot:CAMPEP_0194479234 /NCGR_PEP_ID=MMETSP0253-20130528/2416_1 /TAXON_ID=2966 /ORGANISM="Noctiluca scintillans" /LENGTH=694 /DNA_ID=CAMNT_0039318421 /DNA_START=59 /DNA_END=2143 /DNA_ORIENTATION=+
MSKLFSSFFKTTKQVSGFSSSETQPAAPAPEGVLQKRYEWWWLGWEQKAPMTSDQWTQYDPHVSLHLTASYAAMGFEGRSEGLLLDLAPFTDPPSPYSVWRELPYEVLNRNEKELREHLAIAGYSKDLWERPHDQLPPCARQGKLVIGFYQIRTEHVEMLNGMRAYLTDDRSPSYPYTDLPKRRVVLCFEIDRPNFMFADPDRFRKKKNKAVVAAVQGAPVREGDSVPHGEAVFQWWWGNPETGVGHWKNYHAHVSARLEAALSNSADFANCVAPVDIDGVRYSLQRISRERPFDYLGQPSREPFLPSNIVTVDNQVFDAQTRLCANCFVQFQKGNPKRRRQVRRVRKGEAAGLDIAEGEPCSVCFSESGFLTGCDKGHIVCASCVRMGLRVAVGDKTQTTNLVCGCLSTIDEVALKSLAKKADDTLQEMLNNGPIEVNAKRESEMEIAAIRQYFGVPNQIPDDIFQRKLDEWMIKVFQHQTEHLYHACSTPGCGFENWIFRTDFDSQHRSKGQYMWRCRAGHLNSVLPEKVDIDEVNKNLLMHPEYYTTRCGHDSMPLRRYRICPECVGEGLLTFAVHDEGCKQWPGRAAGHRHSFCFSCCGKWGQACDHRTACQDPGVQQVRKVKNDMGVEGLELGYVNGVHYTGWVLGTNTECPPTKFRGGKVHVLGSTRQGQLGMEDRAELRKALNEGTR